MERQLWLGIDTSGKKGSVAIAGDEEAIIFYHVKKGHYEQIDTAVETLLERAGVSVSDITGVAVIAGPGFFTGLRVGAAYAKGIALALDVPLAFVTSFEAMAFGLEDGRYLFSVDMGRQMCCLADVTVKGGKISTMDVRNIPRDEVKDAVANFEGVGVAGDPELWSCLDERLKRFSPQDALKAARVALVRQDLRFVPFETRLLYECNNKKTQRR